jgi:hypothetical protein
MVTAPKAATAAVRLLFVALSLLLLPQADCFAEHACNGHKHQKHFDGSTFEAWSRTWHGPNAFLCPLTPYYIPRTAPCPAYGDHFHGCSNGHSNGYGNGCSGCKCGAVGEYYMEGADAMYSPHSPTVCANGELPCGEGGFERLGQIPNEIATAGQLPPGILTEPAR